MKKFLFLGAMAAMLLGTASCSNEMEPAMGGEVPVSFAIDLGDNIDSRTISDGTGANQLKFAVFENGTEIPALAQTVAVADKKATINTKLVKGHTYKFVFWAQNSACTAYNTTNMSAIKVNYAANCNDETRDAFYKMDSFTVTEPFEKTEVLTRPFAQINFLADDAAGVVGVDAYKSKVTVTGVPTTLNTLDGTVGAETTDVTFDYATLVNETLAGYETYKYVAMNYILAATDKEMKNKVVLTVNDGTQDVNTVTVANCPVQRNYRTNIFGSLFTIEGKFNITIDPIYGTPDLEPETVWDGVTKTEPALVDGTYTITCNEELAYIFQNEETLTRATKVVITKDLNMGLKPFNGLIEHTGGAGAPSIHINDLTIEGQNHTIKGMVKTLIPWFNHTRLVFNDLTIADSEIQALSNGSNTAALVGFMDLGWGTVEFNNVHILNTKISGGDRMGGIFAYASGTPSKTMYINNCSVEGCELTGAEHAGPACAAATQGGQTLMIKNFTTKNNMVTTTRNDMTAGTVFGTINAKGTIKIYNLTDEGNVIKNAQGTINTNVYGRFVGADCHLFIDDVEVQQ